ncbi:caspase domain-containing protein [Mycena capillaripes]|nr:caspase domain-containing protein [Mycena capillaripes]
MTTAMEHIDSPNLSGARDIFALIIGIDKYDAGEKNGLPPLQGAVNDATEFKNFLLDKDEGLGVPPSRIKFLQNRQATRAEILSQFQSHFLHNPAIPDHGNTAMIFFFAGHGSRISMRENNISSDNMVEAICPVDERTVCKESGYVHAIPDYVLGRLLRMLATKKGDNITVILDSCHSAGMARDGGSSLGSCRGTTSDSRFLSESLDNYLWEGECAEKPGSIWTSSSASHVLLAACSKYGRAYESWSSPVRGWFSVHLIPVLRDAIRESPQRKTYTDLLACLPKSTTQIPFCGGANTDRLVFKTTYPATGRNTLTLTKLSRKDESGPTYSVSIGNVEGVRKGTKFAVLGPDNNVLCTLVAQEVGINASVLGFGGKTAVHIPAGSRGQVKDWNNSDMILRVDTLPNFPYLSTLFPGPGDTVQWMRYTQAKASEEAHIALRRKGDAIIVQPLCGTMLGADTHFKFPLKEGEEKVRLPVVFNGIAHFRSFLESRNGQDLTITRNRPQSLVSKLLSTAKTEFQFALEMHRLQGAYPYMKPDLRVGKNGNMIDKNKVQFRWEENALYGFTIKNMSRVPLFPYLFYFDPTNYTIACWHKPENIGDPAPLKPGGHVTVGMGSEQGFSFRFSTEEAQSESGFLKLLVSTTSLILDRNEQTTSPFSLNFPGIPRLELVRQEIPESWNAFNVVVTMTK